MTYLATKSAKPSASPSRSDRISIDQLVLDKTFQVRTKLNDGAVRRYKEAYHLQQQLDPIRVADVDGMLILIDGWHRVEALKQLGRVMADAEIETMSRDDALWAASIANAKHGVPLSKRDHLKVFNNYIATGRHIKKKGPMGIRYKSYRDIADELPINRSYGTIRNWMTEHYPDIANVMGGVPSLEQGQHSKSSDGGAVYERPDDASRLAGDLLTYFQSLSDPMKRGIVIGAVRDLLAIMEGSPGWDDPGPPEF